MLKVLFSFYSPRRFCIMLALLSVDEGRLITGLLVLCFAKF